MHGNVWEYINPNLIRGGAFHAGANLCRSSSRSGTGDPSGKNPTHGFRVVKSLK